VSIYTDRKYGKGDVPVGKSGRVKKKDICRCLDENVVLAEGQTFRFIGVMNSDERYVVYGRDIMRPVLEDGVYEYEAKMTQTGWELYFCPS
jgi:hypothetical protein